MSASSSDPGGPGGGRHEGPAADRPFAGLVVVDLVEGPLAGTARIFAELGARVVRVAPPRHAPGPASPRDAIRAGVGDLGKVVLPIDPATDEGRAALGALLAEADLVLESHPPRRDMPAVETLLPPERRARVPVVTISFFGRGNSCSDWQATDAVLHALSSELSRSGLDGRAPLPPPGEIALQCAMAQAGHAAMVALYMALATGRGDRVDVAALDGAVQALDPAYGISGSAALGRAARHLPPGRPVKGLLYPIFACRDGHVRLCLLAARQWRNMFRWMGEPPAFADSAYDRTATRQTSPALTAALADFFRDRSRADLEREGTAHGVPISAVLSLAECLATEQIAAGDAVAEIVLPGIGAATVPNGAILIDGRRMTPDAPGTDVRWHTPAVGGDPRRPLAGLKVLDLGVIVVGGEQGRLLADLGADVIKVESVAFPDGTRVSSHLPTGLSVSFAAGHRNKRSLGLDLRDARGKAIFRRLAARADVVLSNFKPGTMASLGFDHDSLAAINPAIVTVESSAFGAIGPWAARAGYGPLVRAAAGLTASWRYRDDTESFSDSVTIYPDHVGARYGAIGVLALLIRRLRTGRGGAVSISQMEVMLGHFAVEIAALGLGQAVAAIDAPWGVFRAEGDDQWCVVTVRDDRDWRALAASIGRADWLADAALATRDGRLACRADLESGLARWMETMDAAAAMHLLQAAGVPAARMLRVVELPDFASFRERGLFRAERHPHLAETVVAERAAMVSTLVADADTRPAPLMGEHSGAVLADWLGLDQASIDALFADTVIEPVAPAIVAMLARGEGRGQA